MPLARDLRELKPGNAFREGDEKTKYWIRDGKVIFGHYPLRGADASTFRFYAGSFGKDSKNCYCTFSKLTGARAATFRALNYTYATDGESVWCLGGKLKEADAKSFVVCDDGVYVSEWPDDRLRFPHGFGKDASRVFYYDFDGKPNWVRKASPKSFVSLNDGFFGRDEFFVFFGFAVLPKADVTRWKKIQGHYSKDDRRIFFANHEIKRADYDTFKVFVTNSWQLARDKSRYYRAHFEITAKEFASLHKS